MQRAHSGVCADPPLPEGGLRHDTSQDENRSKVPSRHNGPGSTVPPRIVSQVHSFGTPTRLSSREDFRYGGACVYPYLEKEMNLVTPIPNRTTEEKGNTMWQVHSHAIRSLLA
jgi:hypothetical protein